MEEYLRRCLVGTCSPPVDVSMYVYRTIMVPWRLLTIWGVWVTLFLMDEISWMSEVSRSPACLHFKREISITTGVWSHARMDSRRFWSIKGLNIEDEKENVKMIFSTTFTTYCHVEIYIFLDADIYSRPYTKMLPRTALPYPVSFSSRGWWLWETGVCSVLQGCHNLHISKEIRVWIQQRAIFHHATDLIWGRSITWCEDIQ